VSARPELRVIEDPLTGFDGELTAENLDLLAGRVQELHAERRALQVQLQHSKDTVEGHERTMRSQSATITELTRDRDAEARGSELWPVAERLFAIWLAATGNRNPRSKLTTDRFELVRPFLRGAEGDEISYDPAAGPPRNRLEECAAAIVGRVFDHYSVTRPNGSTKHFWEWNRIFGDGRRRSSADNFEDSRDRRPRNWRERLRELDPGPQ
jgi:hypothetical protein